MVCSCGSNGYTARYDLPHPTSPSPGEPIKENRMSRSTVHHCASGQEFAPGSFESCALCNPPSEEQLAQALEYYIERPPTQDELNDLRDYISNHPAGDMAEYVDAARAVGAL